MRNLIILLASLAAVSCAKEKGIEEQLTNFSKIEGEWKLQAGIDSYDQWTKNEDGMIGQGLFIDKVGDTTITEAYFLEPNDGLLRLQVLRGLDQTIDFYLTESSKKRFVFENPQHNFPSKMTYIISKNEYEVFLEGDIGGGLQQETLVYRRK